MGDWDGTPSTWQQPWQQGWEPPPEPQLGAPVAPVQAPAHLTGRAHPIGTISMVLALLLTAAIFGQLAAASAAGDRAEVIDELRLLSTVDDALVERVNDVDSKVRSASVLSSASWVVCGVLWIVWQRRYVRNAGRFGAISPSLGWGTWGWLVPLGGYYLPQSQLANAARQTDPHQLLGRSGMSPPVLYVWWVLFGAAHLTRFASDLTMGDAAAAVFRGRFDLGSYHTAIDRLERSDQLLSLSYWLGAAAALAAAATVLVCTDRQRKLLGALGVAS